MPQTHDRPRERLHSRGADALTDIELVAILLGTGAAGRSAAAVASDLLDEWGGLGGLGRADVEELSRHAGVGSAKACRLIAAFALADRVVAPEAGQVVRNSGDIAAIASTRIGRSRVEEVLLVVLDGRHQVQRSLIVARGSATECVMPVREILSTTLRYGGVAFAVAHNHPSGALGPSTEDLAVTGHLELAAEHLGLRFLDHVIVSRESWRGLRASR